MCFFDENLDYIDKCAEFHAREINRVIPFCDYEETKQDLMLYVWRCKDQYRTKRASTHTFISTLIKTKRRRIINSFRHKRTLQTISLNYA